MTENLPNAALREELEKLKRYRTGLIETSGRAAYDARLLAVVDEMQRRDLLTPDTAAMLRPGPRCTLRPLADNVVVLPEKEPDVTPGGIVKPDSAKAVPSQGEVLAIGPGRIEPGVGTIVMSLSIGDRVLFGRYSGLEFVLDGEKVLIMPERDILGVLG